MSSSNDESYWDEYITKNPYSFSKVAEGLASSTAVNSISAWKLKHKYSALTTKDVEQWIHVIQTETSASEQKQELNYMYGVLKSEYPTPEFYDEFLELLEIIQESMLLEAFRKCGQDFDDSQRIWLKVVQYYTARQDFEVLKVLFDERLSTPHKHIQQTFEAYSTFVSSQDSPNYIEVMKSARKTVSQTEKQMRYYEQLEYLLAQNPEDSSLWIRYMNQLEKFKDSLMPFARITLVFYRSLFAGGICRIGDESWIPVWKTILKIGFADTIFSQLEAHRIAIQFAKACPKTCEAYSDLLLTIEKGADFNSLREQIELSECFLIASYDTWLVLVLNILTKEFQLYRNGDEGFLSTQMISDLQNFGLRAAEECTDLSHAVVRLAVAILEHISQSEEDGLSQISLGLVAATFETFAEQSEIWIFAFRYFVDHNHFKYIKKLLTLVEEDVFVVNNPEQIMNEVLQYHRLHSTNDVLRVAINKSSQLLDAVKVTKAKKVEEDFVDEEMEDVEEQTHTKKAKHSSHSLDEPKRSREQLRVKMTGLPASVSEKQIRTFLDGYSHPLSVDIYEVSSNELSAIVELNTEQEVLFCLSLSVKEFDGCTISITRVFANTLWITNYPPSFGPKDITDLMRSLDLKLLNVRFPSQNDKRERRFCYADFDDVEHATEAQTKLNGLVVDGHAIRAQISNPSLKKERDAPPTARQVYVHNLNFGTTNEASLREFFSVVGDVEAIKVPLNDRNRNLGNTNNGYAFVTFVTESAAKDALNLSGNDLDGRKIDVSTVKTKQALQNPSVFEDAKTVTIENISEIVSSEQLKAFLAAKIGPVTRIQLQPSKKAALVEFLKVSDAGKASIALDGTEYEKNIIHVGSKDRFTSLESNTQQHSLAKKPVMVPPMLMRRRPKKK